MNPINKGILEYYTDKENEIQQEVCIFIMAVRNPKTKTDPDILPQLAGFYSKLIKHELKHE